MVILLGTIPTQAAWVISNITHLQVGCSSDQLTETTGSLSVSGTVNCSSGYTFYEFKWTYPDGSTTATGTSISNLTQTGEYKVESRCRKWTSKGWTYETTDTKFVSVGYEVSYKDFSGTREANTTAGRGVENVGSNNWCRGASSHNLLPSSIDGWAEIKIDATNQHRIMSLTEFGMTTHCYNYPDYGVYMKNNGNLYRVISGTQTLIGTYNVDDLIRIERSGTYFKIFQNGTSISSTSYGSTFQNKELLLEVNVYNNGDIIDNIGFSHPAPFDIETYFEPIICDESTGGYIGLDPCGDNGDYSFDWSSGETTSYITNKSPGQYDVTIEGPDDWVVKKTFSLGYFPDWRDLQNTTVSSSDVTKASGTSGNWDAGAKSTPSFVVNSSNNHWVEFEVKQNSKECALGISTSPDGSSLNINYGMAVDSDGTRNRVSGGTYTDRLENLKIGDVVRLDVQGNTLEILVNEWKMASYSPASDTYFLEASMRDGNSQFEIVRTSESFSCSRQRTRPLVKLDGGCWRVEDGILRIIYDEDYNDQDGELTFNIYDQHKTLVLSDASLTVSIDKGDNILDIDLRCSGNALDAGFYILEVKNEKKETWKLRFEQTQTISCN